jgi:hypothetical protein
MSVVKIGVHQSAISHASASCSLLALASICPKATAPRLPPAQPQRRWPHPNPKKQKKTHCGREDSLGRHALAAGRWSWSAGPSMGTPEARHVHTAGACPGPRGCPGTGRAGKADVRALWPQVGRLQATERPMLLRPRARHVLLWGPACAAQHCRCRRRSSRGGLSSLWKRDPSSPSFDFFRAPSPQSTSPQLSGRPPRTALEPAGRRFGRPRRPPRRRVIARVRRARAPWCRDGAELHGAVLEADATGCNWTGCIADRMHRFAHHAHALNAHALNAMQEAG